MTIRSGTFSAFKYLQLQNSTQSDEISHNWHFQTSWRTSPQLHEFTNAWE